MTLNEYYDALMSYASEVFDHSEEVAEQRWHNLVFESESSVDHDHLYVLYLNWAHGFGPKPLRPL